MLNVIFFGYLVPMVTILMLDNKFKVYKGYEDSEVLKMAFIPGVNILNALGASAAVIKKL
jgi:hypothetical protein